MNKKAQELNIKLLVVIIIALLVLVISVVFFSSGIKEIFSSLMNKIKIALGLWNASALP
ncbi:MAG: hypothetical protein QW622_02355 [Candidatus Pacearchaeota archaeon]